MRRVDKVVSVARPVKNSADVVLGPQPKPREELMRERISYSSRLAFIITGTCNIRCRHCLAEAEPTRRDNLEWPILERAIRDAASLETIEVICFTGGEAFLKRAMLQRALLLCSDLGLDTTVMTNGYWAQNLAKALETLRGLPGLTRLGLSTDQFHQEFIPVDYIHNAILACNELGIDCAVRICHLNNPDAEIEAVRQQLIDVAGLYSIEHQPVEPEGRANTYISPDAFYRFDPGAAFCQSADTHAVNIRGDLTACCGVSSNWEGQHLLWLGNIHNHSVSELLKAAKVNPVVHALRLWGPAGLLQLCRQQAEREGLLLTEPIWGDMCSLCHCLACEPYFANLVYRAVHNPESYRYISLACFMELGEVSMFTDLC